MPVTLTGQRSSIQLQNAGPEGNAVNAGAPIVAASAIPSVYGKDTPVEVPTETVYELVKGYGDAAERAMKAERRGGDPYGSRLPCEFFHFPENQQAYR